MRCCASGFWYPLPMKRYLLLLTLPTAALALERTASTPPSTYAGGAGGGKISLPVCHPSQALTVKNGGFACMNIQPNILIVGSCTTTSAPPWTYRAEVFCPEGYLRTGCNGGARGSGHSYGPSIVEPFTHNDRQGCRASAVNPNGAANVQVYAECLGEPGLTPKVEMIEATGCWTPPMGGDGGYHSWADAGEGGDAGGDSGGDGGGGDGGGGDGG